MGAITKLVDYFWPKARPDPEKTDIAYSYLQTLSGRPSYYYGQHESVYEISLVRSCIHRKAIETSKASAKVLNGDKDIEYIVGYEPNSLQTASQFYYRLRTIYEIENNAFIIPMTDERGKIIGLFPAVFSSAEVKLIGGKLYLCYMFGTGDKRMIEYDRVGHLKKYQFKNDFYGEPNTSFSKTAQLEKAIEDANSNILEKTNDIQFLAQINGNMAKADSLKKEQELLYNLNLSKDNRTGVFAFDSRWENIQQIKYDAKMIDADTKAAIDDSVYSYMNISKNIVQNTYSEDEWNAFYESEIEPFFIQLGEALTKIFYRRSEIYLGQQITFATDRLQYASIKSKISIANEGLDRGYLNRNDVRAIFNMPGIGPEGDKYEKRAEYVPLTDRQGVDSGESGNKDA